MEKVKLTPEQARAINIIRGDTNEGLTHPNMITQIKKGWENKPFLSLNELTIEEFTKAVLGAYEAEPEFKVGEWVVAETKDDGPFTGPVTEVERGGQETFIWFGINDKGNSYRTNIANVRHATPEEITKEKQYRWWTKHDREVWELRKEDCLIPKHDKHSCQVKFVEEADEEGILLVDGIKDEFYEGKHDLQLLRDKYKVICFAEDRKDV